MLHDPEDRYSEVCLADFIIHVPIVAQVSEVGHGPLVLPIRH